MQGGAGRLRALGQRALAWAKEPHNALGLALLILGVGILVSLWGGSYSALFRHSLDPSRCNDDARAQIYPFLRYGEPGLFPHDPPGDYVLATLGWGYRLLFMAGAQLGDVRTMSKVLPYVLFALTAGGLGWAASRWGGIASALVAIALSLSTEVFIERMAGGLPRAFGFVIAAWSAAALIQGRMVLLAAVTCLGALFYSAAAIPPGGALALVALLFPAKHRGSIATWSFKRRLLLVAGTGVLSALFLVPTMISLAPYGGYVRPVDVGEYPEAGGGGRFYPGDAPPYKPFFVTLAEEAPKPLLGGGEPLTKALHGAGATKEGVSRARSALAFLFIGLAIGSYARLFRRTSSAKRLFALVLSAVVGFLISYEVVPYMYLPQRYLAFPAPVIVTILTATAGVGLLGAPSGSRRRGLRNALAVLALGATCLVVLGGRGNPRIGINTSQGNPNLHAYLGTLPKDVTIAGWPAGMMDNVPYFSGRQAFLMFETHLPFHRKHTDELRRRAEALIAAYFASDLEPLRTLRDRWGVTHVLVDLGHFKGTPPRYLKPFDRMIPGAYAAGERAGFILPTLVNDGATFRDGNLAVIDLARVLR